MSIGNYIKRGIRYILHGVPNKEVKAYISYLYPDHRLDGKRIVITGGGRGLGFAMAKKFTAEGAEVLITGRNEDTLKTASEKLGCRYLVLDVRNVEEFDSFIEKADQMLGGFNCLVNNAGISLHEGDIMNVSKEQFDSQFDTNLRSGYFLSQRFIRYYGEKNLSGGNILFVSSERGTYADDIPYGLTKAAVNSLVQGLANRVIPKGIRVNAIAPGVTASDMTGLKSEGNLYYKYNMTERTYLPEEMAEIAAFLLSDAARLLSGQILVCNEGKSINTYWR